MKIASWVWPAVLLLLAGIPVGYSYYLHRTLTRTNDAMIEEMTEPVRTFYRNGSRISLILVPVILIGCAVLMFTGNVDVQFGETSLTIEATYWDDLTVDYAGIDSVEYREDGVDGERVGGY
jgi:hypothetical protein